MKIPDPIGDLAPALIMVLLGGGACSHHAPLRPLVVAAPKSAGYQCPDTHQGWDCTVIRDFWFIDQGSKLMPYKWLLHLERADRSESFKDSLPQYGFLPDPLPEHDGLNPDKLPIGFTNHKNDKKDGNDWAGLTCAACHTTRIDYQDQQYFIDGGPNLLDFDSFFDDLVAALRATLDNTDGRFDRFKEALAADHAVPPDLFAKLKAQTEYLEHRHRINETPLRGGYGRVDAFGQIFNQLLVMFMGNPDSTAVPAAAPVSFPFLWDIAQQEVVQWNGSAPNLGLEGPGSVLRNIGEVLGVFGEMYGLDTPDSYETSAVVPNLQKIESWITKLRAPLWRWPVDAAAAERGRTIYEETGCIDCHAAIDKPEYPLPITMTPVDEVRTDSQMIDQFMSRRGDTHRLLGRKVGVSRNPFKTFGEMGDARDVAGHLSAGAYGWAMNPGGLAKVSGYFKLVGAGELQVTSYKARPLDGIWATAPFLHNGSVPTLTQLLEAPEKRVSTFCVGSRQYDPVNVGYVTACSDGTSRFDTSKHGNGNIGHAYGTQLSASAKKDLIEYLKTL